jgi:elongation factor Ts
VYSFFNLKTTIKMADIKASDVAKLRNMSGAGMMDCKKALEEANGDFDRAFDILREKGKKIASKRADRDAKEGVILAQVAGNGAYGVMVSLNCETDFVAKNADFIASTQSFVDAALASKPVGIDGLKALKVKERTIGDICTDLTGIIGEKIDVYYYDSIDAAFVAAYIHPGNKLASIVGFSKVVDASVARDIAMQVAAMDPVALDNADVPQSMIDHEIEIGKEQARNEGKAEAMLEKISMGRLQKFFKESTLLNQDFIKDNKLTVKAYLQTIDKEATIVAFKRYSLNA